MNHKSIACLCVVLLLLGLTSSIAEVPALIHYQGRVLDDGCPLNGSNSLVLRLYNSSSAGSLLYADSNNVVLADGVYSTMLGDDTIFGSLTDAMTNTAVYLEVDINGAILSPRERLVSVPYALMAGSALPGSITPGMLEKQYQSGCFTVDVSAVSWSTNIHISFPNTFNTTPIIAFSHDSASAVTPQIVSVNKTTGGCDVRVSVVDWNSVAIDTELACGGQVSSALLTNGYPAAAYYKAEGYEALRYARAMDSDGFDWASPVTIETADNAEIGFSPSLCIVNGNPAIAYYGIYANTTNHIVRYVRAADPNGNTWNAPVTIATYGKPTVDGAPVMVSLCEVDGAPAIAYSKTSPAGALIYVRALDANGTSWPGGTTVDGTSDAKSYLSLALVNGNPAIAYASGNNYRYIRATDIRGTAWGTPVTARTNAYLEEGPSLTMVNGRPAIVAGNKYLRASDANGSAWPAATVFDAPWNNGQPKPDLSIIDGKPAIAYYVGYLHYITSPDVNGSSWSAHFQNNDASVSGAPSLLQLADNTPAIVYPMIYSRLGFMRLGARFVVEWVAVEP